MRLLIYTHGKTGSTALAYSVLARLPDHRLIFEPPSLDIIPDEQNLVVKYISPNWAKDQQDIAGYDSVIVLVRHPFDVLISAVMYFPFTARDFLDNRRMNEFYRLLQQLEAHDVNVSMRTVWEWLIELRPDYPLTWSILRQFERLRFAIASMKDHVLTKYEDACDPGIEPVNGKLWFPISTQTTIASAFEHVERSKGAGGWRNWFSTEDCRYFAGIAEIRRYARTCGYDLNVPVAAVQVRDARVGSEYVRRLVDGQRKRFNVSPFGPADEIRRSVPPKLLDALTLRLDLRDNQKAFETALCACVEQPRHPAALLELGIGALLNRFTAAAQTRPFPGSFFVSQQFHCLELSCRKLPGHRTIAGGGQSSPRSHPTSNQTAPITISFSAACLTDWAGGRRLKSTFASRSNHRAASKISNGH